MFGVWPLDIGSKLSDNPLREEGLECVCKECRTVGSLVAIDCTGKEPRLGDAVLHALFVTEESAGNEVSKGDRERELLIPETSELLGRKRSLLSPSPGS